MIFFPHVVKTGGSTIWDHLDKHLPGFNGTPDYNPEASLWQSHDVFLRLMRDGDKCMIIVREPVSWLRSVYNHEMAKDRSLGLPFWRWYDHVGPDQVIPHPANRNRLYHYLSRFHGYQPSLKRIKAWIADAWFVSVTEMLDEHLPLLFRELQVPTEFVRSRQTGGPRHWMDSRPIVDLAPEIGGADKMRIYRDNPLDVELYRAALKRATSLPMKGPLYD